MGKHFESKCWEHSSSTSRAITSAGSVPPSYALQSPLYVRTNSSGRHQHSHSLMTHLGLRTLGVVTRRCAIVIALPRARLLRLSHAAVTSDSTFFLPSCWHRQARQCCLPNSLLYRSGTSRTRHQTPTYSGWNHLKPIEATVATPSIPPVGNYSINKQSQ